jgi:hypothetical protein
LEGVAQFVIPGGTKMATVAIVDGIKIQFYNEEHPPPHFHAEYAESRP